MTLLNLHKLLLCSTQHTKMAKMEITAITPERVYVRPHLGLRGSISHYTLYVPRHDTPPGQINIVPDASGSIVCCLNGQHLETHFWGPTSHAVTVENNPQKLSLYIMVEFLPCGANRLLNIPMSLLHNTQAPLASIDAPLARLIAERFEAYAAPGPSQDIGTFLTSLDNIFLERLERTEESVLSQHIVNAVQQSNGTLRVAEISRQTKYSERHLNRVMAEHLGLSTKLLARIIRINAACRGIESPATSLTNLAHQLHYHDQSHFIRDFTAICGLTPGEYIQRMSDFYNEELKLGATLPSK